MYIDFLKSIKDCALYALPECIVLIGHLKFVNLIHNVPVSLILAVTKEHYSTDDHIAVPTALVKSHTKDAGRRD